MLAGQLRQLEEDGVVLRIDARTSLPRVDYMLTKPGEDLIPLMRTMCDWGCRHLGLTPNLPRPIQAVPRV